MKRKHIAPVSVGEGKQVYGRHLSAVAVLLSPFLLVTHFLSISLFLKSIDTCVYSQFCSNFYPPSHFHCTSLSLCLCGSVRAKGMHGVLCVYIYRENWVHQKVLRTCSQTHKNGISIRIRYFLIYEDDDRCSWHLCLLLSSHTFCVPFYCNNI